MNALERAIRTLVQLLECQQVPYMVIGGIANLVWGEPRSTLGVDVSVLVEDAAWPRLIEACTPAFRVLPRHPKTFVGETHPAA